MRRMRTPVPRQDVPPPEAGDLVDYETWLAEEIAAGCAELNAGEGIPAEQVWQALGLE
jgi:predicted transcriptional regulator